MMIPVTKQNFPTLRCPICLDDIKKNGTAREETADKCSKDNQHVQYAHGENQLVVITEVIQDVILSIVLLIGTIECGRCHIR